MVNKSVYISVINVFSKPLHNQQHQLISTNNYLYQQHTLPTITLTTNVITNNVLASSGHDFDVVDGDVPQVSFSFVGREPDFVFVVVADRHFMLNPIHSLSAANAE